jgi:hypothetical protein
MTFVLMAVPPVTAGVWLAVPRLVLSGLAGTALVVVGVCWLLLGLAGIAAATFAVSKIVRTCTFPPATATPSAPAAV